MTTTIQQPSNDGGMMEDMPVPLHDKIHNDKDEYEVLEILGKGAFGAVFKVKRLSDGKELAMKCETYKVKKQVLKHEAKVLIATSKIASVHVTQFEDRGMVRSRFVFIVMRLVGRNLWDIRSELPGKKFSLPTAMLVAQQTLAGIRDVHRAGFLHRDVKPPNFATGREEDGTLHTVYVLDFGMCREYRTETKAIRMPREKTGFRGTTRYASLNALEGKELCRKDDVESWWYMVIETLITNLPWKHCKGTERLEVLQYKKQLKENSFEMSKLLAGHVPAKCFRTIFTYLLTVEYNMIPDYDYIYWELEAVRKEQKLADTLDWDPNAKEYKGPKYELGLCKNEAKKENRSNKSTKVTEKAADSAMKSIKGIKEIVFKQPKSTDDKVSKSKKDKKTTQLPIKSI